MKYFIKTFGCQMNFSDSERIISFLEKHNLNPAENISKADLIIFNTCGVRQTAEDRVYGQTHNLRKNNKKCIIVITGCLAQRKDVQKVLKDKADLFIPIDKITTIFEQLPRLLHSRPKPPTNYLSVAPQYQNKESASVPIMTGCNNFCSYCVVPYARGREWSRSPEDIFKEIETLKNKNYKKIVLLGQNVNSYQLSGSASQRLESDEITTFSTLLNVLAKTYPKIKFNFLTSHPKDFSNNLIEVIAKNKNVSRKIHLPIQSGSDKILKLMNRPYTQKKYLNLIEKIKKQIPNAKLSTDVIVGFPSETEKNFQRTADVFRRVGYFEAYINKYSPRPGTASFNLGDPISWNEKKRRERILRKLIKK